MIMHQSKAEKKLRAGRRTLARFCSSIPRSLCGWFSCRAILQCIIIRDRKKAESVVLYSSLRNVDCRTRGPIAQLALEKRLSAASTQQLHNDMRYFNHKVFYRQDQETHFLPSFCCPPPLLVVCRAGRPGLDSLMFCVRNCRSAPEFLFGQQRTW
jgi:hypothetical protein